MAGIGQLLVLLMALCALPLAAQGATASSAFAVEGKRYFLENKPMEAAPLLERAVSANPADEDSRLWLGYAYEQLGRLDDAVAAYRAGAARSGPRKQVFLFNMANCFATQGKAAFAEEAYGQAIAVKPEWAPPYLNRANARMRQGSLQEAAADYRVYLSLDPASPQAGEIRRLLALLGGEIEAAQARAAEAEAKRLADEAARQALMDEVARSLLEAAQDTTSLSAGGEDVQGYVDPLELDD